MIKYHGTPFGGTRDEVVKFFSCSRHALVPFGRLDDFPIIADAASSFMIDNGAFSAWTKGVKPDWGAYLKFVNKVSLHPRFDFCVAPDVIDGSESENDSLLAVFASCYRFSARLAPVWHLHESIDRLMRLCSKYERVCMGSSGQYRTPGSGIWWRRMFDAFSRICDSDGNPPCKLHGLRMLNPEVFTRLPFSSADSTNAARNSCNLSRFGSYAAPSRAARAEAIALRIEAQNSPAVFDGRNLSGKVC